MCSEKWKGMTDEDKQPFHEMAENDKKRYDDEMREYVPDPSLGGAGGSKKRKRAPKDPDAPKKALSAFFLFCHDERGAIKERNPSYSVGEVAKELGKLWADADPEIKNKYKEAAENAKLRYNEEFAEYQQKKTREANGDYSTSSHRSPGEFYNPNFTFSPRTRRLISVILVARGQNSNSFFLFLSLFSPIKILNLIRFFYSFREIYTFFINN